LNIKNIIQGFSTFVYALVTRYILIIYIWNLLPQVQAVVWECIHGVTEEGRPVYQPVLYDVVDWYTRATKHRWHQLHKRGIMSWRTRPCKEVSIIKAASEPVNVDAMYLCITKTPKWYPYYITDLHIRIFSCNLILMCAKIGSGGITKTLCILCHFCCVFVSMVLSAML